MKKIITSLKIMSALMLGTSAIITYAQAQEFSDYPVKQIFEGKQAKLKFSSENGSDMFKSRISKDVKAGVNYAGAYNVVKIGCGSSCMNAYVVNLNDGTIIKFPLGGELNYQMMLQYNVRSRLIKAVWNDTETTPDKACVIDYFEIKVDEFKQVNSFRKPAQDGYCDAYIDE